MNLFFVLLPVSNFVIKHDVSEAGCASETSSVIKNKTMDEEEEECYVTETDFFLYIWRSQTVTEAEG